MKRVLFTDAHCHTFSQFSKQEGETQNMRLFHALEAIRQVREYCDQNSVKEVWFLGDLFEEREVIRTEVMNGVFDEIEKLAKGRKLTFLTGNHDFDWKELHSALHSLRSLGVTVYENNIHLPSPVDVDTRVAFVPYTNDPEVVRRAVESLCAFDAKHRILLGHLAVEGAVVGWHEYQPPIGISPSVFKPLIEKGGVVRLGHYHKRQEVMPGVEYIGALIPRTFAEAGNVPGFTVLDFQDGHVKEEFVEVSAPQFVILREGDDDWMGIDPDRGSTLLTGNYVRYDGERRDEEEKIRQAIKRHMPRAITFNWTRSYKKEARLPEVKPTTELPEMIEKYVTQEKGPLDDKKLVDVGLKTSETV